MRDDLTDITLVVDRSGSMQQIRDDAEGGVNAFIAEQARQEGEALLTLVQFDTEYEFLCRGVPIAEAPRYVLEPRGMTALLDAVGRAINETGQRLAAMPEAERPGLVVFVVMTDGQENSSAEFTAEQVREMIRHQTEKYAWTFTFLGADASAFDQASAMGVSAASSARYHPSKVGHAYASLSAKVARLRGQRRSGQEVVDAFTDEERKAME